jgi:hypothetical protein
MKMKRTITTLCVLLCVALAHAQDVTKNLTMYQSYQPAMIHMTSGKSIKNLYTNIFLKNGALLYLQGEKTMEARMETIAGVDFDDRKYINIDNQLAAALDTVGNNILYCISLIDVDAYNQMLRNNVNITNLSFSDHMSYSTIDLTAYEDQELPIIYIFYYLYNGKLVRVHEREISRLLDKEKKRRYKTILSLPEFNWTDRESLVNLLKAITD